MTTQLDPVQRAAKLFDELAPEYDRSGVSLFGPIAERLVELLEVAPGERALDVGCGKGAATFPLAEATGPAGAVTGIDISVEMVGLARAAAEESGLDQVRLEVMDAGAPTLPEGSFDAVASSLVIFFLPDPAAALSAWVRLTRPGGRIGITTFGPQDEVWTAVDALFDPFLPAGLLDARTSGKQGPFGSTEGVTRLMSAAGAVEAHTLEEVLPVRFGDAEGWRRFTMSVGQRAFWGFVPAEEREPLFERAAGLLDDARDESGEIVLNQLVRYTLARSPE